MSAANSKPPRPRPRKRRRRGEPGGYLLQLFIAGMSPRSVAAIRSIRRICDEYLPGTHVLEIVDLYRQPARAGEEQIVAAPALIKKRPLPLRRIIGNLTDENRVMAALGMKQP